MSDTTPLGFPAAAQTLGVSVRALRQAIRTGTLPAPPQAGATAVLPAEWVEHAKTATEAAPLPSPGAAEGPALRPLSGHVRVPQASGAHARICPVPR